MYTLVPVFGLVILCLAIVVYCVWRWWPRSTRQMTIEINGRGLTLNGRQLHRDYSVEGFRNALGPCSRTGSAKNSAFDHWELWGLSAERPQGGTAYHFLQIAVRAALPGEEEDPEFHGAIIVDRRRVDRDTRPSQLLRMGFNQDPLIDNIFEYEFCGSQVSIQFLNAIEEVDDNSTITDIFIRLQQQ